MGAGAAMQGGQGGPMGRGPGEMGAPGKGMGMGAPPAGGMGGMGGLGGMYGGMPNPFAAQQPSQMQNMIGPAPMQGAPGGAFGAYNAMNAPASPYKTGAMPGNMTPFGQADMSHIAQLGNMLGGQPQAPMQGMGAYGPQPPQMQGIGSLVGPSGMGGMGNVGGQLRST